jgi:hypothetical protein
MRIKNLIIGQIKENLYYATKLFVYFCMMTAENIDVKNILGLKLPSDPRWVNLAEMQLEDILTDHAYCEQKLQPPAFH